LRVELSCADPRELAQRPCHQKSGTGGILEEIINKLLFRLDSRDDCSTAAVVVLTVLLTAFLALAVYLGTKYALKRLNYHHMPTFSLDEDEYLDN
jgi:hypothetical protein